MRLRGLLRWLWYYYWHGYCIIHDENTTQGDVRYSWTECKSCTADMDARHLARRDAMICKVKADKS